MNIDTATYTELEKARAEKEAELARLDAATWKDETLDSWNKLKKCEAELQRIAKALDRALQR